jgi:hypothetical protein
MILSTGLPHEARRLCDRLVMQLESADRHVDTEDCSAATPMQDHHLDAY